MLFNMELQKGRPQNTEGRLEKEIRCYDLLDSLGIEYGRVDHYPADHADVCDAINEVLEAEICKNLFLTNKQQTAFYMLMIPLHKKFKTKEISSQIGSARLSFASAEKMLEFLDITPGSVSVLGLMNDKGGNVQLLVDEDLLKSEYVGCHPCINTSSLKLRTADVFGPLTRAMNHSYRTVTLVGED